MSCKATKLAIPKHLISAEDADLPGRFAICPEEVRFWISEVSEMSEMSEMGMGQNPGTW